jgi:hypothetical protein
VNVPKPWLEPGSDATELEQALLRAGVDNEIPEDAQAAVWSALAARLDALPPGDPDGDMGGPDGDAGGTSGPGDGGAGLGGGGASPMAAPGGGLTTGGGLATGGGAATAAGTVGAAKLLLLSAFGLGALAGAGLAAITLGFEDESTGATTVEASAQGVPRSAPVTPPLHAGQPAPRPDAPAAVKRDEPAPASWAPAGAPESPPTAGAPPRRAPGAPLPTAATRAGTDTAVTTHAPAGLAAAPPGPSVAAFAPPLEAEAPRAPQPPSPPQTAEQRQSQLREEAAVLRQAREALRRDDLAGAFAALEVARTRFPGGALIQEREALTIELLARSGQMDAARQRADAFLRAHPSSAHATRVREVLKRP